VLGCCQHVPGVTTTSLRQAGGRFSGLPARAAGQAPVASVAVSFDDNAQLDTSQVSDVRGSGGFGIPGGGKTIGGGLAGLLITVVLGLLGVNGVLPGTSGSGSDDGRALAEKCAASNPDRFEQTDCRNIAYINDIQQFWARALGERYRPAQTVLFSRAVTTGCGSATSAVGPFYCPADEQVYVDLTFYDELASRFGAPGEFAQAYVLAHEYGHHIQNLTGTERQVRRLQQNDPGRANRYSVALELQADCYAGVWTAHAGGGPVATVSQADIREGLQAAAAVGDDAIQGSDVHSETWTHGSSAQRQQWFSRGHETGDPDRCDTLTGR
jgi:predicted metalloprotease